MSESKAELVGIVCPHGRPDHVRCSICSGDDGPWWPEPDEGEVCQSNTVCRGTCDRHSALRPEHRNPPGGTTQPKGTAP